MKKMKFLIAACTLLSGLALTSCNKQNATAPAGHNQGNSTQVAKSAGSAEDLGDLHTAGMEYFVKNAAFKDPAKEVNSVTLDFCKDQGYDVDAIGEILENEVVAVVLTDRDPKALQRYFETKGMKAENDFLSSMITAINTASSDEAAVKALNSVAEKVNASKELGDESKAALLQGIAVGKSSVSYWVKQTELGKESAWVIKASGATGADPGTTAFKIKWKKVGVQDLVGAIVGGIFGGWMGALGGGIAASAGEIVGQLM